MIEHFSRCEEGCIAEYVYKFGDVRARIQFANKASTNRSILGPIRTIFLKVSSLSITHFYYGSKRNAIYGFVCHSLSIPFPPHRSMCSVAQYNCVSLLAFTSLVILFHSFHFISFINVFFLLFFSSLFYSVAFVCLFCCINGDKNEKPFRSTICHNILLPFF